MREGGLARLNNVDIVLTSDTEKWSRCIVVETASDNYIFAQGPQTVGGTDMFDIRQSPSVGKDGEPDGDGIGYSWFPGYAIDVETGKRMNIFFGENSIYNETLANEMMKMKLKFAFGKIHPTLTQTINHVTTRQRFS